MARRFKVEGTNDFLIAAVGLAALGLWCVKDGWFPSASVLAKHPRAIVVAAARAAVVESVEVAEGHEIGTNTVVARVRSVEAAAGSAEDQGAPTELRSPAPGTVQSIRARKMDQVTAGQPIVVVTPEDHFYAFNKSLAFITLIGAVICGFIHLTVR